MSGDKFILIDDEGRERPGTEFTMPYIDSSIGNCGVVFSDYSGLPAKDLPFMTAIYEPDSVLLSPESLELIPTRHVKTHTVSPATQAPDTVATSDSLKLVEISGMAIIDDSKTMYPGGEEALFKFLRDNIKYPEEASKNNIGGVRSRAVHRRGRRISLQYRNCKQRTSGPRRRSPARRQPDAQMEQF